MKATLQLRRTMIRRELARVNRAIKRTRKSLVRLEARLTFFGTAQEPVGRGDSGKSRPTN